LKVTIVMKIRLILSAAIVLSFIAIWPKWWRSTDSNGTSEDAAFRTSPQRLVQAKPEFRGEAPLPSSSEEFADELNRLVIIERFAGLQVHPISLRMREALDAWASIDPEAALQWALNAEDVEKLTYDFSAQIIRQVAASDPGKAKEMMGGFKDSKWRASAVHAIVEALGHQDPEAAFAYARDNLEGEIDSETAAALVAGIVRNDVPRSLEFLNDLASTIDRHAPIRDIAQAWGVLNFDAAWEWANTLKGHERVWALEELGPIWTQTDPEAALNHLVSAFQIPKSLVFQCLGEWGKTNHQGALKWLEGSSVAKYPEASYYIHRGWLTALPKESVAAADLSGAPPGERDELLSLKVDLIKREFPEQAATILEEISSAYQASIVVHFLISDWCQTDAQAAASWVSTLRDSPLKETSILSLIDATIEKNPDIAVAWLAKVGDPQRRIQLIERAGPLWLFFDEATGRQQLHDLGLSDEEIVKLQRRIHEPREDDGPR
jgi:hypothetical protein